MKTVSRSERGMTLIELVLGVVITGVIVTALLGAMFTGMHTIDDTNDRITGSNDTQLIASYFTSDVVSAEYASTTGTVTHSAPSVTASNAASYYVGFWALQGIATTTVPEGMVTAWQAQGPTTLVAADEALTATGATDDRVLTSSTGTSSVNHAVTFAPAVLSTITRTGTKTKSATNASSISVDKPTTAGTNDLLLAHIVVAGGTSTSVKTTPAGWTLLTSKDVGTTVKSLLYQHKLAAGESSWTWTFSPSRDVTTGVVSYSGVATAGVGSGKATEVSPCGGTTPALLLSWTDRGSPTNPLTSVAYVGSTSAGQTSLVRMRCSGVSGTPVSVETLANALAPNSVQAVCSKPGCAPLPVTVTLSLAEPPARGQTIGRGYQLRATTRTSE